MHDPIPDESQPGRPAFVSVGGIFVDDIVYPDGTVRMGVLGGGVSHAAAGMRIWAQRAGLIACAGRDLPETAQSRLARDFDLAGMIWLDLPQVRAWQLFEWDGRRREIYRVDVLHPFIYDPPAEEAPSVYDDAAALYLLRDAAPLPGWRARYPDAVLLWEPLQQYMLPENAAEFRAHVRHVDIVSPNWLEAGAVYGFDTPERLVRAMLDDGASVAALRMGEAGSMVGRRGEDGVLHVPPVPVPEVIDQTGAGNTYCGGFLVGWTQTRDVKRAGAYGAVAASFSLETPGVADPPAGFEAERDARLAWTLERVRPAVST